MGRQTIRACREAVMARRRDSDLRVGPTPETVAWQAHVRKEDSGLLAIMLIAAEAWGVYDPATQRWRGAEPKPRKLREDGVVDLAAYREKR